MNRLLNEFVNFVVRDAPVNNKDAVKSACVTKFNLIQDRSVFHCEYFAVRFCYTKNSSFSNTVLSLSALEKYDKIPFFVVLVKREADNQIFLSNSTFISKLSHSSKGLSMTNLRGSFNGSDIMKQYANLDNSPSNFEDLIAIHNGLDWSENLQRIVEATSQIIPVKNKYQPSENDTCNIFKSVQKAIDFVNSSNYKILLDDLNQRCDCNKEAILIASHIENVNIRGRLIEAIITSDDENRKKILLNLKEMEQALPIYDTKNGLGDYVRLFKNEETLTDIKTKVIYLDSAPKAFNVDKFLETMSKGNTIFFFYFIGINENSIMNTILCSVYHSRLIDCTILQHHWAGRNSRGVAQYSGKVINEMLNHKEFCNEINVEKSKSFLEKLLKR